ncbi:39S ribosomal protein L47, mitochondrial [Lampris incognitus]|uniref:39S ribosomal protein L47, mitochondrial n=1 Tax=Lampris incognitus TaxID=2546036 RepID=UPI0024B4EC58|nr:39S ribosomal protein L47, mitochondrial [Lampris incognitus]
MAATSLGGILTLCRQFQNVLRVSAGLKPAQYKAVSLTKCPSYSLRQSSPLAVPSWHSHLSTPSQCQFLHTTVSRPGLDEFFDLPENWGESTVKSGAPWTATKLRAKSNEDLHKLWYVLLKEKNMLLTIEQESKRQRLQMPSPERVKKVERSMKRLEMVVNERETALRLLQTGHEKGTPGDWRRNVFGKVFWQRFKEHVIPWYMNKHYKRRVYYTPKFVEPHVRLRIEKYLRAKARKANLEKRTLAKLKEKFPEMKVAA